MGSLSTHDDPAALFVEHEGDFYRPHPNGGGLVALTANVDLRVFVGAHAMIKDTASVHGDYFIVDTAVVGGSACLIGGGRLKDAAVVDGRARLEGFIVVAGQARVSGDALVRGRIFLKYNAYIAGTSRLLGELLVSA